MAIDERFIVLINASIDGEIPDDDRRELDRFLAESAEGRVLMAELKQVCSTLDGMEERSPPPHLKHVILDSVAPKVKTMDTTANYWQTVFSLPSLRYAGAFALGVILTGTIISSDRISRNAFDDVTGLVGTMSSTPVDVALDGQSISLSSNDIAGTVTARREGQIMVIDFDLVSHGPVDIVADFSDPDIWFNGFAQLESTGTRISAESGRVRMTMEGKRRYAMYLHNASGGQATVELSFFAAGALIHEDVLNFEGTR